MKSSGFACVALAALAATCVARPVLHPAVTLRSTALLEETSRRVSSSGVSAKLSKTLRGWGSAAPTEEEAADLKKKISKLEATNRKIALFAKAEREQLTKLQGEEKRAAQKVLQERNKLDFAVDQENTEMLAVKILQGENAHLKEALQNQTSIQAALSDEERADEAKAARIQQLQTQGANASKEKLALLGQLAEVKHRNGLLEDQYITERSRLASVADRDTSESLALQVLRGENRRLKEQMRKTDEEEADVVKVAKDNQAKAAESDALLAENDDLKRALAGMREREAALQQKSAEMQETIVSMAAKSRQAAVVTAKAAKREVPRPAGQDAIAPKGLEKASDELSKLTRQLQRLHGRP